MKKVNKFIFEIENQQLKILKKVKQFINYQKKNKIDTSLSNFGFFSTYGHSPGKFLLEFWLKKINIFELVNKLTKAVFSISSLHNYQILNFKNQNFVNLFISWGKLENFSNGTYIDNFLNYNSKNLKNSLIFVISLDNKFPNKIPSNVIIFLKKDNSRSFSYLLKSFCIFLKKNLFNLNRFIYYFSYNPIYSKIIFDNIKLIINNQKIKKIILPYEGQTSQNFMIQEIKKINSNCITIGITHAMIPALPLNFIHREGSPDKIYLTGQDQKNLFVRRLGWKKDQIFLIPSLRLKKKKIISNKNIIFLPLKIEKPREILNIMHNYLINFKHDHKTLVIRNHPQSQKIKNNIIVFNNLNKIILKLKLQTNLNKKNVFFYIGSTSAFIENLEKGIDAIHISSNPVLECYSNRLWPNIDLLSKSTNIFEYKLNKKKRLILLSAKNYSLLNTNIL